MWSLMLIGTGYIHVMYLGRAPHTKETLLDFREEMSGHLTFTSFRGLTGSQRTLWIWGVTVLSPSEPSVPEIIFPSTG